MSYPAIPDFKRLVNHIEEYARLSHEFGADPSGLLLEAENALLSVKERLLSLKPDEGLAQKEPDGYSAILALRPAGRRRLWEEFRPEQYADRLKGALLARLWGCVLGAAVEFWTIPAMKSWAEYIGDEFPPVDYWSRLKDESALRYHMSRCVEYTRGGMDGVPVDDDITYTQLGLLIAEEYGTEFTTRDVGAAWLKYLPYACTAEEAALNALRAGVPAEEAALCQNPYVQWIGADIRSDPWAYIAPAYPEKAAQMAYHDAYLSHRRNGIYGEMFFSAAQSAAFAVSHPIEAIEAGLLEIPAECALAGAVKWALGECENVRDYEAARAAVDAKFAGMSGVHTLNNACLTIFGLAIGGCDVTKVISQTVAMGLDNDCTAATAGSIVGAVVGAKNIPEHWYRGFNNSCKTYLKGVGTFRIDDMLARFERLALEVHSK